jgi:NADH-quinone oxidoreductase subunit N
MGAISGPRIDWTATSPLIALVAGACVVLLVGLMRAPFVRQTLVPLLSLAALGASAGLAIGTWGDNVSVISGAMRMDDLTHVLTVMFCAAGAGAGSRRARRGTGSSTRCCSPPCWG